MASEIEIAKVKVSLVPQKYSIKITYISDIRRKLIATYTVKITIGMPYFKIEFVKEKNMLEI